MCNPCDIIMGMYMLNYSNCLTGTPADLNFRKLTTSHFNALITQNSNQNMPIMFLIVNLNENLRSCNENLAWGNQEPLIHPYMFGTQQKVRKQRKLHFSSF